MESDDFMKGCQNAVMEFQRQYNLRNKYVVVNPSKNPLGKPTKSQPKKYELMK